MSKINLPFKKFKKIESHCRIKDVSKMNDKLSVLLNFPSCLHKLITGIFEFEIRTALEKMNFVCPVMKAPYQPHLVTIF